ncbi:MAG: SGNH/GDSL hydrolase family protein [Candidatus Omnitrophica bacterium]|nr:SGNH/GDSL hydrolase family protein [Candidatus Omnitrophota bacterium]
MMTKTRFLKFAVATVMISTVLIVGALLGLDLWYHKRFEKVAGMNWRGYRGPVVHRKLPGEQRVAVLGGSTAFCFGVSGAEAWPAALERSVNAQRRARHQGPVSIVNLGALHVGAYSFTDTLRDYASLDYDVALFYTGYNDLGAPNIRNIRRESPLFRLTGYYPILPLVVKEKLMALRYGGNLEAAYLAEQGKRPTFRPNYTQVQSSEGAQAVAAVKKALLEFPEEDLVVHGDLSRALGAVNAQQVQLAAEGCGDLWAFYCWSLERAVSVALDDGKTVMVVTQPYLSPRHIQQQQVMTRRLQERWKDDPRIQYVNVGQTADLRDPALCFDGIHLTVQGNQRIAEALVDPLLQRLD